jgi:hypothetical protein
MEASTCPILIVRQCQFITIPFVWCCSKNQQKSKTVLGAATIVATKISCMTKTTICCTVGSSPKPRMSDLAYSGKPWVPSLCSHASGTTWVPSLCSHDSSPKRRRRLFGAKWVNFETLYLSSMLP